MDNGWTKNPGAVGDSNRVLCIRSKSIWRFTLGFCAYFNDPLAEGFWFLNGPGIHLTGNW